MTSPQEARPLVSVIVPAYNAAATLSESLESLIAQDYSDWEAVVVDDGSTDATAAIAAEFATRDPRIRMLSTANAGVAAARNAGIADTEGTLVAPLDADDLWHPAYLATMIARMSATDAPVIAYAACRLIDGQSLVIGSGPNFVANGLAVRRMLYCNLVGNGSAMVVRRSALLKAGGYDPGLRAVGAQGCEDYLLQLKLAAIGSVAAAGRYLVGYRLTPGAMSRDPARMFRSIKLARRRFLAEHPEAMPSRRLARWIRAQDLLARAHGTARAGRTGVAALLAVRAGLDDPGGAALAVAGRLRSVLSLRKRTLAVPFAAIDPDLAATTLQPGRFAQLQRRRLAIIAEPEAGSAGAEQP